jgi:predicted TIM-barrel fold metal-dependent hydrolase
MPQYPPHYRKAGRAPRRNAVVVRAVLGILSFLCCVSCGLATPQAAAESSTEALRRIQAERKVINVHEHVDSLPQAEEVVKLMDRQGIAKTILLGSSWFTFALYERVGFTRFDENNATLLDIVNTYPGRFEAWPTLNPTDPDSLAKVRALHEKGATGLKLYTGHGYRTRYSNRYMFHTVAMDDPRLLPIYAYCAENHLPICMHVNSDMPGFADEFVRVLTQFPDLKINNPHWMLSSIRQSRLREYLDVFPNVYADISFGHDDFLIEGLRRISRYRESFQKLFNDYPTRFFFGTDLVFTNLRPKDSSWLDPRLQAYYDLLSKDTYTTELLPGETLRGLALPPDLLENVLYKNYERFAAAKPKGTVLPRAVNWSNMATRPVTRAAGEALPPPPEWRR